MDESQMPYAKRKTPDSKDYILHKSAYMTFQRRQNYRKRKQISGHLGLGMRVRGEADYKGSERNFFEADGTLL